MHGASSFASNTSYLCRGLSCRVGAGIGKVAQMCKSAVQHVFTIIAQWFAKVKAGVCSLFRKKVAPVSASDIPVLPPPFSSQDMAVIALKKALVNEIQGVESLTRLENKPEVIRSWLNASENQKVLESITRLRLKGTDLFVIPEEIKVLTNLSYLSLANNQIEEIPPGIFSNLKNLKELNLFDNQITEINKEAFKGLNKLKVLNLGDNCIEVIDSQAFAPCKEAVKVIDVSNNQLSFLHDNLFQDFHSNGFVLNIGGNLSSTNDMTTSMRKKDLIKGLRIRIV